MFFHNDIHYIIRLFISYRRISNTLPLTGDISKSAIIFYSCEIDNVASPAWYKGKQKKNFILLYFYYFHFITIILRRILLSFNHYVLSAIDTPRAKIIRKTSYFANYNIYSLVITHLNWYAAWINNLICMIKIQTQILWKLIL